MRHTASLIAFRVMTSLCTKAAELRSRFDTSNRQVRDLNATCWSRSVLVMYALLHVADVNVLLCCV